MRQERRYEILSVLKKLLTNVEKVIKFYLQRFFTYLFTLPY
jgi:hypothetical protein